MKRILLLVPIFFCHLISYSQSGELDPSFGNKGLVKTDFGFIFDYNYATSGRQVLLQPDGSMYILIEAGALLNRQSYLAKRLSDGTPDISYADNGFSAPVHIVEGSAAQQPDGKIVVAGVHTGIYTIARYNTNGTLDNSFDGDGMHSVDFAPVAVAIQSDGKILIAGAISNGNDNDFAIARYKTNGTLDETFDEDGQQTTDFNGDDYAISIAIQNDNKIVVAGRTFQSTTDFVVARYNTDGSLDNSFSGDGKQITDFNSFEDVSKSLAIQSDGKIVVAGYSGSGGNNQFALARYNSDGTPDNSFDGDGKKVSDFGSEYIATSLFIQDDGKLVVTGYAFAASNADFATARFNTDGTVDDSFGDGGKKLNGFGGDDHANSVAVQSDGKIVVAGEKDDGAYLAVARYNVDGTLDEDFNEDGKFTDQLHLNQGSTFYTSTAIQSDGKIVAAGYTWNGSNYDFAIARYNTNGSLDNNFSDDGRQNTDFNDQDDFVYSLAIQGDGKIVVTGYTWNGNNYDFATARYNADGIPDNGFSGDGRATTDFTFNEMARSVVIQSDGKIVVAGSTVNRTDVNSQQPTSDFALVRYNTNGTLDNTFSGDGKLTTDFGFDDIAKSAAIQSDGRIVVAGTKLSYSQSENTSQFAVARYNTNGTLDNSFSNDGKVLTPINDNAYGNSVAIGSDGKLVVGGTTSFENDVTTDFALARYNTNGTLDDTFGENFDGTETTYFGSAYRFANAVGILPDGKIILAGGTNNDFTLVGYNIDGTLNSDFGEGGIKITAASAADDRIEGMAIGNDKLYVAGYGQSPGNLGFVASYLLAAGGPVPVTLIDFTASLKNNEVPLQWHTGIEKNLSQFIIERSSDGNNFLTIGIVAAFGNSALVKNYSLTDQQPLPGANFYRLKMVDIDGKFVYSKIVAIKIAENNFPLQIFPNPARDILHVQAIGENEKAIIQIVDISGKKIKEIKVVLNGTTSLSVDINNLPPGTYSLLLNKKENITVRKFIKQ